MKKTFRNGNGVFEVAREATGRAAEKLRAVIRWNDIKERSATKRGRDFDAARHAKNKADCQLQLIRLANQQASA